MTGSTCHICALSQGCLNSRTWLCRGKRVAYEVLMGLHYLHGFKVVMLDLKSPNVLLAADGTAKLADVGLARLMTVTSFSHKVPTGTWAWAAPEALLGHKVRSCL